MTCREPTATVTGSTWVCYVVVFTPPHLHPSCLMHVCQAPPRQADHIMKKTVDLTVDRNAEEKQWDIRVVPMPTKMYPMSEWA